MFHSVITQYYYELYVPYSWMFIVYVGKLNPLGSQNHFYCKEVLMVVDVHIYIFLFNHSIGNHNTTR